MKPKRGTYSGSHCFIHIDVRTLWLRGVVLYWEVYNISSLSTSAEPRSVSSERTMRLESPSTQRMPPEHLGNQEPQRSHGLLSEDLEQQEQFVHGEVLEILFPRRCANSVENIESSLQLNESGQATFANITANTAATDATASICMVCLDTILGSSMKREQVAHGGNCNHIFHFDCLMEWMTTSRRENSCPSCRHPLWDIVLYAAVRNEVLRANGISSGEIVHRSIAAATERHTSVQATQTSNTQTASTTIRPTDAI